MFLPNAQAFVLLILIMWDLSLPALLAINRVSPLCYGWKSMLFGAVHYVSLHPRYSLIGALPWVSHLGDQPRTMQRPVLPKARNRAIKEAHHPRPCLQQCLLRWGSRVLLFDGKADP